jgi:hypothetical protein
LAKLKKMAIQKRLRKTSALPQISILIGSFVSGPLGPNTIKLFLAKCMKKLAKNRK